MYSDFCTPKFFAGNVPSCSAEPVGTDRGRFAFACCICMQHCFYYSPVIYFVNIFLVFSDYFFSSYFCLIYCPSAACTFPSKENFHLQRGFYFRVRNEPSCHKLFKTAYKNRDRTLPAGGLSRSFTLPHTFFLVVVIHFPLNKASGYGVDLKFIFSAAIPQLTLIHSTAIVVIQLDGDQRSSGCLFQRHSFCLF